MNKLRTIFYSAFLFTSFCCNSNNDEEYFHAIRTNDIKLHTPREGEWLYAHKEKGQTLQQYISANPARPSPQRSVIYLLPLGEFTEPQKQILELTRQYTEIFFQLRTVLLKPVNDSAIPATAKRETADNGLQILAPYILDSLLKKNIPDSAYALMAISEKDLYPKDDWNFVFGLASYTERAGVSSIYRFEDKKPGNANFTLCTRRLMNVSSHEIGHMFSLHHCIYAKCVMNGSNSMPETDNTPNRLCSQCQEKLYWNIRYNNKKRLGELCNFFRENKMERDLQILQADIKATD